MYPHERSLVKKLANKPFAIIGVNSDPDRELLKSRIKDEDITWRSFWCGPGGGWGRIPTRCRRGCKPDCRAPRGGRLSTTQDMKAECVS